MAKKDSKNPNKLTDTQENITCSTDHCDTLLMHIHEQFAVNNTSTFGSLITLFVAMVASLGAYGYYTIELIKISSVSSRHVLIFVTTSCVVVLSIIAYISLYQGYRYRKEQKIIDKIRKHYDVKNEIFGKDKLIPWTAKDKTLCDFMPGFYCVFAFISLILIIIITVVTSCLTYSGTTWWLIGTTILSIFFIFYKWIKMFLNFRQKKRTIQN